MKKIKIVKTINYDITYCRSCRFFGSMSGCWTCFFNNRKPRRISYEEIYFDNFPKWCPLPNKKEL